MRAFLERLRDILNPAGQSPVMRQVFEAEEIKGAVNANRIRYLFTALLLVNILMVSGRTG